MKSAQKKIPEGYRWDNLTGQSGICLKLGELENRISDRAEVISFVKEKILQRLVEVTRKQKRIQIPPTQSLILSLDTAYKSEQVGFDGGKKKT